MKLPQRQFISRAAVRKEVPFLLGLYGPSGCGKTFSALRLANGFRRVTGGDIHVIDTEAGRALHYANMKPGPNLEPFKFVHTPLAPPFSPLDYAAAIEHCIKQGARTIVVDSMSHEHEGEGGVLWQHDETVEAKGKSFDQVGWIRPKRQRQFMTQRILQASGVNFIFCFRAKQKLAYKKKGEGGDKDPTPLGWMPIAGDIIYELTVCALLLPNGKGTPTWTGFEAGERSIVKVPHQFRDLETKHGQLTEQLGEGFASWARGGSGIEPAPNVEPAPPPPIEKLTDPKPTTNDDEETI